MSEFEEVIDTATTDGEISTESTEQVEIGDTDQVEQTTTEGTAQETAQEKQERLFKQSELDAIIEKRLAKERQRFESETKTAAQQARDSWIAEQGYEWKGKPIQTEAEYKQALQEQDMENEIRSQYANVPDDIVNELLEGKRFREQYMTEKQQAEQQQKQQKMYSEFLEAYPDIKPEEIPMEVWKEVNEGRNLTDAYVRHENKLLKDKLNGVQQQQQTQQANLSNASTSTGSVRDGGNGGEFISQDEFETNKHDQSWIMKNYSKIQKSRAKW